MTRDVSRRSEGCDRRTVGLRGALGAAHGTVVLVALAAGLSAAAPGAEPAAAEDADLARRQKQIAADFRRFQDVLLRMGELTEGTDPGRSRLLQQAVRQSEEALIGVQIDALIDLLDKRQLSRAVENQDRLVADLRALLDLLLSEDRARRIESEKARVGEYLRRLNQIIRQQKSLEGRTAGSADPKPLADEQRRLGDRTGDLAQDIRESEEPRGEPPDNGARGRPGDRPGDDGAEQGDGAKPNEAPAEKGRQGEPSEDEPKGSSQQAPGSEGGPSPQPDPGDPSSQDPPNPARQRIEAARQRMDEARRKLEQAEREGAVEKQEEALQELEQAKAELEEILRQLREEEIERTLAALEVRFAKMLRMQRDVYEGTVRLDKVPAADRTPSHEIEAARLGRTEAEIVLEADKALLLLRDDGSSASFPEALEQARADMRRVVAWLERAKVDDETQAIEQEVIEALEEMIEAFQQAREDAERKPPAPAPPGAPQDQPLVDALAELRMIRAMQMRINRRTERYSTLIEGEQAENAELLEALAELAERQQRVHEITRDLEAGKNQ